MDSSLVQSLSRFQVDAQFSACVWFNKKLNSVSLCKISERKKGDLNIPPRKVPGFTKYAVDVNLFQLEFSILMQAKRATIRNNIATEKRGEGEFSGGEYT